MDEEYTFEVRATNTDGIASLLPAEYEWEVADLAAPVTTITSFPADPTSATTATFAYTASEPADFECSLDGEQFGVCPDDRDHLQRPRRRPAHVPRPGDLPVRAREPRGAAGRVHVDGRQRGSCRGHHGDAAGLGDLHVHRERQPHGGRRPRLPVQARHARLHGVHEPEDVLGPAASASTPSRCARSTPPATSAPARQPHAGRCSTRPLRRRR